MLRITVHFPLSAKKNVMLGSFCSVFSASLSCVEKLDGGNLALESAADTKVHMHTHTHTTRELRHFYRTRDLFYMPVISYLCLFCQI